VNGVPVAVAPGDQGLVTELASLVVEQVVPDELAVLPMAAQDYFADPAGTLAPPDRDQPLGFGLDLALMTPYVLAVATPVVQFLGSLATDIAKDVVKDDATPIVHDVVRRMFHRGPPQSAPVVLTPDQVDRVREQSYRNALALGLADDQARLLADALASSVNRGR
jgi:hypothetical protein